MPVISQAAAEELLQPFATELVGIVHDAWADWLANPIAPNMQNKRVRADVVWNQMVTHAKNRLDGQAGVRVKSMAPWDGVMIGDKIFLRLKKADDRLFSRNYPTQSAMAFVDQDQDLFEGIARADLVYVLDESETEIEHVAVVQRHKNSIAWVVDLMGAAPMAQEVIPFPTAPVQDGSSVADRIIKPKKQADKDVASGGE
jgi:hypothetical protein